jgi:hypothetical protein
LLHGRSPGSMTSGDSPPKNGRSTKQIDISTSWYAFSMLARERCELDPPVRIHVHTRHLIVYRIAEDHVAILRLLGARHDWVSMLKAADS